MHNLTPIEGTRTYYEDFEFPGTHHCNLAITYVVSPHRCKECGRVWVVRESRWYYLTEYNKKVW